MKGTIKGFQTEVSEARLPQEKITQQNIWSQPSYFPFYAGGEGRGEGKPHTLLHTTNTSCELDNVHFQVHSKGEDKMPRVMSTHLRTAEAPRNTTGLQPSKSQGAVKEKTDLGDANFSSLSCLFLFRNGNCP